MEIYRDERESTERWFVLVLSIWAAAVFAASYFGLVAALPRLWIAPLVAVGIFAPVAVYYRRPEFRSYIRSLDPKHLTIFHLWRIPAGLAFLDYGSRGWLPEQFVANAGYGDLAVGLLVPVVLVWPGGISKYLIFHLFGMLDFTIAVGTGITFTLLQVPRMENIATFPIALIPLYGVCVTGALSIMTLDALWQTVKKRTQTGA